MKIFEKVIFKALLFYFGFYSINLAQVFGVSKDTILNYAKIYDLEFYYKNLENNNTLRYNSSKNYCHEQLMDFYAETLGTPLNTKKYIFLNFSPEGLAMPP